MYFPYFRGRQYELLALKELVQNNLISNHVIPIVEPAKISPTLKNTIQVFENSNQKVAMVFNPAVGDLANSDISTLFEIDSDIIIPAVIFNESAEDAISNMGKNGIAKNEILAVLNKQDYVDDYKELYSSDDPAYVLFPDERQMRRSVKKNKVLFEDKFNKQSKNSDYLKCDDEPFSEDHLFLLNKGIVGLEITQLLVTITRKADFLLAPLLFILFISQMIRD